MGTSLYEQLGGEAALRAAVELFYKKIMADEVTRPFFTGLELKQLINKQLAFMTWAFGGPIENRGRDLREAHAPLVRKGLGDAHFDAVAKHLNDTLVELGVAEPLIKRAMGIVGGTRNMVLGR